MNWECRNCNKDKFKYKCKHKYACKYEIYKYNYNNQSIDGTTHYSGNILDEKSVEGCMTAIKDAAVGSAWYMGKKSLLGFWSDTTVMIDFITIINAQHFDGEHSDDDGHDGDDMWW